MRQLLCQAFGNARHQQGLVCHAGWEGHSPIPIQWRRQKFQLRGPPLFPSLSLSSFLPFFFPPFDPPLPSSVLPFPSSFSLPSLFLEVGPLKCS